MTDWTVYWPFAHIIVVTVPLVCGSFHLPARPGMAYWPVAGEVATGAVNRYVNIISSKSYPISQPK
jgi:hypothetical protein